jgi:hypothetical protein
MRVGYVSIGLCGVSIQSKLASTHQDGRGGGDGGGDGGEGGGGDGGGLRGGHGKPFGGGLGGIGGGAGDGGGGGGGANTCVRRQTTLLSTPANRGGYQSH